MSDPLQCERTQVYKFALTKPTSHVIILHSDIQSKSEGRVQALSSTENGAGYEILRAGRLQMRPMTVFSEVGYGRQ